MYNKVVNYTKYYIYSRLIAITVINELRKTSEDLGNIFKTSRPKEYKRYSLYLIYSTYTALTLFLAI